VREVYFVFCILPANAALAGSVCLSLWNAVVGGLGIFLGPGLALGGFAPVGICPAVLADLEPFEVILHERLSHGTNPAKSTIRVG